MSAKSGKASILTCPSLLDAIERVCALLDRDKASMSGADNSAEISSEQGGNAGSEMPHAALLQMIEEDDTSEEAIEQLKAFLTAYLQKINEHDLVCVLQGFLSCKHSSRRPPKYPSTGCLHSSYYNIGNCGP